MPLLKAVVLDWAGTTVDHGSLAPVRTIQSVFAEAGIAVSEADARIDMGLPKKDHLRNLLGRIGHNNSEPEVERFYALFIPRQLAIIEQYSTLIPGVLEAVSDLRRRGLKIGSTTGYTRPMLNLLAARAAAQGYTPDCALVPDDVPAGRPHPFMIYETALRLNTYPLWAFVKVGDTPSDIDEGRNAGTWTIGVTRTGNMVGLDLDAFQQLPAHDAAARVRTAEENLRAAGAHYTVESVSEIGPVLDAIEHALQLGQRP